MSRYNSIFLPGRSAISDCDSSRGISLIWRGVEIVWFWYDEGDFVEGEIPSENESSINGHWTASQTKNSELKIKTKIYS